MPAHTRTLPECYDLAQQPNVATCKALWESIDQGDVYFRLADIDDKEWDDWKNRV